MSQTKEIAVGNWLKDNPLIKYFSSNPPKASPLIIITILFVIAAYVWFISFGLWTTWHDTTDYYDQLATAFEHGSLSLEKKVEPALLTLANPYNPKERQGIDYPLDFSMYKGRYFLYFGPVPALLLAVLKLLGFGRIGDQYLVFLFSSGWFVFQSLLIIELRQQLFPDTPKGMLPICIFCAGLISPISWMLTEGRIYEAAITGGQFFFLAGLYFIIKDLAKGSLRPARLFLGGILWVFAVGSRITLVLPIGFFTIIIILLYMKSYFQTRAVSRTLVPAAALLLPLALGMVLMGWYNWARFDSILETGWSYQLSTPYLQKYRSDLFSTLYILPNSYEYVVAPPRIDRVFPFLHSVRARGYLLFSFIKLPAIYHTRAITGILFSTPFILFAGISFISILLPKKLLEYQNPVKIDTDYLRWTLMGLSGSFLFGFAPIVSHFWVVTRYITDFSPSLVLLSILGFWLGYRFLAPWPMARKVYLFGGVSLMFASVVISSLLVLSIRTPNYQAWNPVLWNHLTNLFSW
jgi:hypothetical protein